MDKATKLHTLYDRIHLIDLRFEVIRRDIRLELQAARLSAQSRSAFDKAS